MRRGGERGGCGGGGGGERGVLEERVTCTYTLYIWFVERGMGEGREGDCGGREGGLHVHVGLKEERGGMGC